ncbi:extracellular solute-binding protein [Streptomyces sp. NPDC018045]|uniref:extracellular solute-binding protein n=1 Tax=Streptomyces sp. NPDC018045 TaxID=3365037 RepID=UPI003789A175
MTSERIITVWVPHYPVIPDHAQEMQERGDSFCAAHPGYRVEVRAVDWLAFPTEVHRAALRGDPPVLAQYFYTSAQEALDTRTASGEPLFAPIGPALTGRDEILGEPVVLDDLVPAAARYYTRDGDLLAMPSLVSTTLMYANTTLLASAGITEVPRTWAELRTACEAVSSHHGGPAISWPNHGWLFQQALAQQGGLLANHDNGRAARADAVDLLSDELMAYAHWWRALHRDGHYLYLHNGRAVDWDANFRAFADQRVAFTMTTSVEAERMVQAGHDGGFSVRACRLPHNSETGYAGNVIGGDALWLARGLDDATRDGALAFTQYLHHPAAAAERHRRTRFIPVTGDSFRLLDTDGWFDRNPHLRVAVDQLAASGGSPAACGALLGEFAGIQECMTDAMHEVLVDGLAPATAFRAASARAQHTLDHYTAYCAGRTARGPVAVG